MCSSALKMPSSIRRSAIATLKTSHTTRPGWLWVSREKKFDHAIEPAYALVTLILTWEMMTKVQVKASATCGDENTFAKATRYIWVGSAALSIGTRCRIAR